MSAVSAHQDGATVALHVQPKSSRTEAVGEADGWLKLKIAAPPVDGAANREVVSWLGKQLGVPKSSIEFVSGEHARKKVLLIPGLQPDEVRSALGLRPDS